jgi:hypothetical protein
MLLPEKSIEKIMHNPQRKLVLQDPQDKTFSLKSKFSLTSKKTQHRSNTAAKPCPTPTHSEAAP